MRWLEHSSRNNRRSGTNIRGASYEKPGGISLVHPTCTFHMQSFTLWEAFSPMTGGQLLHSDRNTIGMLAERVSYSHTHIGHGRASQQVLLTLPILTIPPTSSIPVCRGFIQQGFNWYSRGRTGTEILTHWPTSLGHELLRVAETRLPPVPPSRKCRSTLGITRHGQLGKRRPLEWRDRLLSAYATPLIWPANHSLSYAAQTRRVSK